MRGALFLTWYRLNLWLSGVAVCLCLCPCLYLCLRSLEVCCFGALGGRVPPPVCVAAVAAADHAFVRPAGVVAAVSAGFAAASAEAAVALTHQRFAAAVFDPADIASVGLSGIPDPAFAGVVESAPGAFAPGAGPQSGPAEKQAGGCCMRLD